MRNPADYPKSKGGLWTNDKKASDKHPDWKGRVNITPEQVRVLHAQLSANKEPVIWLSAWKSRSNAGVPYISIEAECSMPQPQQGYPQPQQGYPQQQPQGYPQPQQRQPQQAPPQQGGWDDDVGF